MECLAFLRLAGAIGVVALLFIQMQLLLTYGVSCFDELWFGDNP